MRTRALTLLSLAALAAALSGCMTITFAGSSQPQSMGPLTLNVQACASGSPSCPAASNSLSIFGFLDSVDTDQTVPVQLLFAARLPDGAVPPDDVVASVAGGGTITYRRNAGYEAQLQTFEPAPAGERWWGWLSDQASYGRKTGQAVSISLQVTLPRPPDGGPLPSPLPWRPVVGGRQIDVGIPVTRPVNCGQTPADFYGGYSEVGQATATISCVSSPDAAATHTDLGAPLIDFGVTGTSVQGPAGSSVTATFLAKRSGDPDPGTTFALAVAGGPPGASVQLDRTSVGLGGDAITPVLATVAVPKGTAPGSYPLTLTATAPGKPARTGTATVAVPDTTPPRILAASLTHTRFRAGAKRTALAAAAGAQRGAHAAKRTALFAAAGAQRDARPGRGGALAARSPQRKRRATPAGTQLRVRLSELATLSVTVQRLRPGHRSHRTCSLRARKGRRCTVIASAGTLTRRLPAGASTIAFSARLGRHALAPGSYRLTLHATDAAGNVSVAKALAFVLLAR